MTLNLRFAASLAAAAITGFTPVAHASCGSAFCTLMTDRYAQTTGDAHPGWSADVRLELVNLDRLRTGTHSLDASQVEDEEAVERHTRNQNLVTTLGYGVDDDWSLSLRVPMVRRDHLHDLIDENTGLVGPSEQWTFTRLGDVQLLARRQFLSADAGAAYAVFGGLKFPTGPTHIANADGSRAERALQPGTGTTDLVIGAAARQSLGMTDAAIGQLSWSQAMNSRDDFKPGRRLEASLGWSHAFSRSLGSVLQLNFRERARDRGAQAEPDNSGSTEVDLSPGLTMAVGEASTLYAYVQLPLYQKVNGVQLVSRHAFALGWTSDC